MNIDTLPDEEIISENPVKYTPLSEWDPYFIDFQTKTEDRIKYIRLREIYSEKFPEFRRLLDVMELSFQTYRSELNRLSQLAVGFLRSAEINDFEHWKTTSRQKWNRLVLTHKQVPQEFYTILLDTANKIRNEYFETEPIRDKILSKETDHATLYEIISEYQQLDVTRKQLLEYLIPMGIWAILKKIPGRKSVDTSHLMVRRYHQMIVQKAWWISYWLSFVWKTMIHFSMNEIR